MGGPNTTKNGKNLKLAKYLTTQVRVLLVSDADDDFLSFCDVKAMEALNVRRIQTRLRVAFVF